MSDEAKVVDCRVCGNRSENTNYVAQEMMFGWRTEFEYVECSRCGCIQIRDIPKDLERYYPREYHADRVVSGYDQTPKAGFMSSGVTAVTLASRNVLFWLPNRFKRFLGLGSWIEWFSGRGLNLRSSVLDVGCGQGYRLSEMARCGFRNLTGIDRYLSNPAGDIGPVHIKRCEIGSVEGAFDLIMAHHSLEHMSDHYGILSAMRERLNDGGMVLIRIPIAGTFAWREYGVHWVQFDAPRHLVLHTVKSMKIMAESAGFAVEDIIFDSTSLQFWGSEQYLRGIPLRDRMSHWQHPEASMFTPEQIRDYEGRAKELNRLEDGDQACFFLRKASYLRGHRYGPRLSPLMG